MAEVRFEELPEVKGPAGIDVEPWTFLVGGSLPSHVVVFNRIHCKHEPSGKFLGMFGGVLTREQAETLSSDERARVLRETFGDAVATMQQQLAEGPPHG
jgi:hypothetical protein